MTGLAELFMQIKNTDLKMKYYLTNEIVSYIGYYTECGYDQKNTKTVEQNHKHRD